MTSQIYAKTQLDSLLAGKATSADIDAKISAQAVLDAASWSARLSRPYTLAPGRKVVFLGDSITNRTGAASGRAFIDQIPKLLGTANVSVDRMVNAGVGGNTTAQMLARYATDVRAQAPDVLVLLCGTNDVSQSRTLAQWSADVRSIAALAQQDGIPVVIGTVPPRSGTVATTTTKTLTAQYNAWLKMWAPTQGIRVADVWQNLISSGSENTLSGYIYTTDGLGVHPETTGHQKIAEAFADAMAGMFTSPHIVQGPVTGNLVTNPIFLGSSATGWNEQTGIGTGNAPTYAFETDTTGRLAAVGGVWRTMLLDQTAAAASAARYYYTSISGAAGASFAVGDTLLITARIMYEDVAGGFYAAANSAAPTADLSLRAYDQGMVLQKTLLDKTVRNPGPIARLFTVPAGMTSLLLTMQATLPVGQNAKFKISEAGVFNVTALPDLSALV